MSVEPGKWGVIYNPKAGTRKVQKRWKEIKEYMDSKGVNYDWDKPPARDILRCKTAVFRFLFPPILP